MGFDLPGSGKFNQLGVEASNSIVVLPHAPASEKHTNNGRVFQQGQIHWQRGDAAACKPHHDDPAPHIHAADALIEDVAADDVKNHVGALATRKFLDLVTETFDPVIDNL